MKLNLKTGLLDGVVQCLSPHRSARPHQDIDLLVIHNISLPPGEFGGPEIIDLFMGRLDTTAHPFFQQLEGLRVSAHVLIDREGKVTQFVPFTEQAWHAGTSAFEGRSACNEFSIGIELEGTDDLPYEPIQYEQLVRITKLLMTHYPGITPDRIVGHSDIAPGRKTDPGPAFEWEVLSS